jgi:hypothetical protein
MFAGIVHAARMAAQILPALQRFTVLVCLARMTWMFSVELAPVVSHMVASSMVLAFIVAAHSFYVLMNSLHACSAVSFHMQHEFF